MSATDAPDSPNVPRIEDVDEDSVTLSWAKPRGDGGDRITGYIIESKMAGTNKWRPLNSKFPCKDLTFVGEFLVSCIPFGFENTALLCN